MPVRVVTPGCRHSRKQFEIDVFGIGKTVGNACGTAAEGGKPDGSRLARIEDAALTAAVVFFAENDLLDLGRDGKAVRITDESINERSFAALIDVERECIRIILPHLADVAEPPCPIARLERRGVLRIKDAAFGYFAHGIVRGAHFKVSVFAGCGKAHGPAQKDGVML